MPDIEPGPVEENLHSFHIKPSVRSKAAEVQGREDEVLMEGLGVLQFLVFSKQTVPIF